jgi:putative xylitol transport system permease protein
MGVMNNSLDIMGVESFYQSIVKGILIVGAVILDASRKDSEG